MSKKLLCPICEKHCSSLNEEKDSSGRSYASFSCSYVRRLLLIDQRLLGLDGPTAQAYYTLLIYDALSNRNGDIRYPLYSIGPVNYETNPRYVYVDLSNVPIWRGSHLEKMDDVLMNICRIYGEGVFRLDTMMGMRAVLSIDEKEAKSMESSLVNFDYIAPAKNPERPGDYIISKEGWLRIRDLYKKQTDRTCFIAISFDKKTRRIRKILCDIIRETGFEPILINEFEHNNQIVPEIEKRIQRCRFVIMDCTLPNNGAYYEAGMATGLGKELIICCREKEFHDDNLRPHFDVRQRSMIIWKNQKELKEKLTNRIVCTIEGARDPTKSQPPL